MLLPPDIKQIFFETLSGDKSVFEFEQWLYADKRLEIILNAEDYLDLISYGYKGDKVKFGLFALLEKHIDKAEYEKYRVRNLLTKALQADRRLPEILMTFYDLYCRGYTFFDNLGLGYGLSVKVPSQAGSWDKLTNDQQQALLSSFNPRLEIEIKKVISWLDDGKIVLTGVIDQYNNFDYIDNRLAIEKQPAAYEIASAGSNTKRKWWKFW